VTTNFCGARRTNGLSQMLCRHFEKRRRVLLHGRTDRSTNVFQDSSEDDQSHSPTTSSSNRSDTRSVGSPDEESSEQEKSDHDSIPPASIEALFRCSFCDRHFESRHSRNQHERKDRHSSDLPEIFRCSFCDGHFESSLYRNEHEKQYKPRLLKYVCTEMGCDKRFTNKDGLKRHVQSVSQAFDLNSEDVLTKFSIPI
jgi:hypothetical protein